MTQSAHGDAAVSDSGRDWRKVYRSITSSEFAAFGDFAPILGSINSGGA